MSRRQQRRDEQQERLHDAFWAAEDSTPARVPDTFEARSIYERESLTRQVVHAIEAEMAARRVTQHELAAELGLSEGRVSQILSGDQNLTLKTVAGLAAALKVHLEVTVRPAIGGVWEGSRPSRPVPEKAALVPPGPPIEIPVMQDEPVDVAVQLVDAPQRR